MSIFGLLIRHITAFSQFGTHHKASRLYSYGRRNRIYTLSAISTSYDHFLCHITNVYRFSFGSAPRPIASTDPTSTLLSRLLMFRTDPLAH